MHSVSLFLGFHVNHEYGALLDNVRSGVLALYVKEGEGMWLQEIVHEGSRYLGRQLGDVADVDQISLHESNICSFLKKLVPSYPYEEHPLVLIPVHTQK